MHFITLKENHLGAILANYDNSPKKETRSALYNMTLVALFKPHAMYLLRFQACITLKYFHNGLKMYLTSCGAFLRILSPTLVYLAEMVGMISPLALARLAGTKSSIESIVETILFMWIACEFLQDSPLEIKNKKSRKVCEYVRLHALDRNCPLRVTVTACK